MTTRRSLRIHLIGFSTSLVLATSLAASASAQAGPSADCLAYPPDDDAVIFCATTASGAVELFEQDGSGTVRQLTFLGGRVDSADVSPNGATIAFEATLTSYGGPQVYRIARWGPRARQVLVGNVVIELGSRQVIVGGEVIEIRGERAHRLTGEGTNRSPRFTPDGDRIGFTSDRLGSMGAWSMDVDGSDQRELLLADVR